MKPSEILAKTASLLTTQGTVENPVDEVTEKIQELFKANEPLGFVAAQNELMSQESKTFQATLQKAMLGIVESLAKTVETIDEISAQVQELRDEFDQKTALFKTAVDAQAATAAQQAAAEAAKAEETKAPETVTVTQPLEKTAEEKAAESAKARAQIAIALEKAVQEGKCSPIEISRFELGGQLSDEAKFALGI